LNNFIKILALSEDAINKIVFISQQNEGGINTVYNPIDDRFEYQVFIHNRFPFKEVSSWQFSNFPEARKFAATEFKSWSLMSWDYQRKRPCELEGRECGTGLCETCKEIVEASGEQLDPERKNKCGSCGMAGDWEE